jgi:hypothetical protein
LVVFCESWPAPPQPLKAGILAMIRAAVDGMIGGEDSAQAARITPEAHPVFSKG